MLPVYKKYFWFSIFLVIFFFAGSMPVLAAPPSQAPSGEGPEAAFHGGNVGYVLAWQLNLRAGPSLDYAVVGVAYSGERVTLLGRTADSVRVKVSRANGQAGWTLTRYIQASPQSIANLPIIDGQPAPTEPTAYVQTPSLNVRGGPGLNYDVIGRLGYGETGRLLGRNADGSWLKIAYSSPYPTFAEPTGWVLARYVWSSVPIHTLPIVDGGTPPPGQTASGVVTVSWLNVRSGPGFGYGITGSLGRGQRVNLLGRTSTGNWLKVTGTGSGQTGWVAANYIHSSVPIFQLPVIGDSSGANRIHFEPGSTSAIRSGSLVANGLDRYVLGARGGQTMTVEVEAAGGNALLSISGANGEVLKSTGAGPATWSGVLPTTQDYFLTISAESSQTLNYTLRVIIP